MLNNAKYIDNEKKIKDLSVKTDLYVLPEEFASWVCED